MSQPTDKPILPDAAIQHISETGQQHAAANVQANFANDLAVAFTDVNGNHTFEANTDQLIAAVVDTNHDNIVDVDDTVQFGTYPLHVDGTAGRGTFTQAARTITHVVAANGGAVMVNTADGDVEWINSPATSKDFETQSHAVNLIDSIFDIKRQQ